jgi:hypothetical protein
MPVFTNENWYYLYLVDQTGDVIYVVDPESSIELPEYFNKYTDLFIRQESTITPVYTPFEIGSEVIVYSNTPELDKNTGYIIDKDEISYKISFGTYGEIWFPYSQVALTNVGEEPVFPPSGSVIFFV